jgi:hypothetical protein
LHLGVARVATYPAHYDIRTRLVLESLCHASVRADLLHNIRAVVNCNSPRRQALAERLAANGDSEMAEAIAERAARPADPEILDILRDLGLDI